MALAGLLAGLHLAPAHAVLGEPLPAAGPVVAGRARAQGAPASGPAWVVQEQVLAAGVVVRQFAQPGGPVFAVAWSGRFKPRQAELLGRYLPAYVQALRPASPTPGMVRQFRGAGGGLLVRESGRPGTYAGLVVAQALLPQGVEVDALR